MTLSADELVGQYRLWRQHAGRGAFARVEVRGVRTPAESGPDEGPVDTGPAGAHLDADELSALASGVARAVRVLKELGVNVADYRIEVSDVQVNLADTEPTAVEAAATAATFDAFGYGNRVQVTFDSGWTCHLTGK